jgi:hypothetical protein
LRVSFDGFSDGVGQRNKDARQSIYHKLVYRILESMSVSFHVRLPAEPNIVPKTVPKPTGNPEWETWIFNQPLERAAHRSAP